MGDEYVCTALKWSFVGFVTAYSRGILVEVSRLATVCCCLPCPLKAPMHQYNSF